MIIDVIGWDIFLNHATTAAAWPQEQQHNSRSGVELTISAGGSQSALQQQQHNNSQDESVLVVYSRMYKVNRTEQFIRDVTYLGPLDFIILLVYAYLEELAVIANVKSPQLIF